ncbi:MAG: hypothetical protein EA402_06950 [Planctomycetota bacterium]|nr:MAG: hypothetical protein EA402_06950 [Planctomycetota bacterium]
MFSVWRLTVLLLVLHMGNQVWLAGEDPRRTAWEQDRARDLLPLIEEQARDSARWTRWYDLGVVAAAADEPAQALWAMATAHRLAPWAEPPRQALQAQLEDQLPPLLSAYLGPLAILAGPWWGGALGLVASLLVGWSLSARLPRPLVQIAVLVLSLWLTVLVLRSLDHRQTWAVSSSALALVQLDADEPLTIPPASLLRLVDANATSAGVLVEDARGRRGRVPVDQLLVVTE